MLTILAPTIRPEVEAIDRDPGIISLGAVIVRSIRATVVALAVQFRAAHQRANEAELFSSSSAWPHNHRAR